MDMQARIRQLGWRSKRGLLELELLLEPFAQCGLAQLTSSELEQYAKLLEHDDLDLYDWLRGRAASDAERDESLQPIVERICQYHSH